MSFLICAVTVFVNITNIPFNETDKRAVKWAKYTCKREYKNCLKTFTKVRVNTYRAICGGNNGKQ